MSMPTPDQIALAEHVLEVISRLPADLRAINLRNDGVTFELAQHIYCRQCHVDTIRAAISLTYAELLMKEPPQYEGDTDLGWDIWGVTTLLSARWDEACEAQRRAKQAKPLSP